MTAWPGWTAEHTLVLPLDDAPPTAAIDLNGLRFEPKRELHITLVGQKLGEELHRVLGYRLDVATRAAFEALDWSGARTGSLWRIEHRVRAKDGKPSVRSTIIEDIELPAMAYLHRWLGTLLGRQLAVPPPHVTLYTHGDARGIGLPTETRLRAHLREAIDPAALGG